MADTENEFDIMVGAHIRNRRIILQMSQTALAEQLGVSFQQVQKYERGQTRMSAATLVRACGALGITPGKLFEEFDLPDFAGPDDLLQSPEEVLMLRALRRIRSPQVRAAVLRLVSIIADEDRTPIDRKSTAPRRN